MPDIAEEKYDDIKEVTVPREAKNLFAEIVAFSHKPHPEFLRRINAAYLKIKELAEAGNAEAQYYLGYILGGKLLEIAEYQEAALWYTLAYQQRHPQAAYELGLLYFYGVGVPCDEPCAISLITEAAELGCVKAQNFIQLFESVSPQQLLPAKEEKSASVDQKHVSLPINRVKYFLSKDPCFDGNKQWQLKRSHSCFFVPDKNIPNGEIKYVATECKGVGGSGAGRCFVAESKNPQNDSKIFVKTFYDKQAAKDAKLEVAFWNRFYPGSAVLVESADHEQCRMVMEHFGDMDLLDAVQSVSPRGVLRLLLNALEQIERLHRSGMVHGDIKAPNFRVKKIGSQYYVFIIDFGNCEDIGKKVNTLEFQFRQLPIKEKENCLRELFANRLLNGLNLTEALKQYSVSMTHEEKLVAIYIEWHRVNSPQTAPEGICGKHHVINPALDIYAFADMFAGLYPNYRKDENLAAIIAQCFVPDPKQRPSIPILKAVLSHALSEQILSKAEGTQENFAEAVKLNSAVLATPNLQDFNLAVYIAAQQLKFKLNSEFFARRFMPM